MPSFILSGVDECSFCKVINGEYVKVSDRVLSNTENFVIKPALGAFVPGSVLILPKKHVFSFAELNQKEVDEFIGLLGGIKDIEQDIYGTNPIVFENASDAAGQGKFADSTLHAHCHIVPVKLSKINHDMVVKERSMRQFDMATELRHQAHSPYLLYVDNDDGEFISQDVERPRQYMRRVIADQLGIFEQWNWREYPNIKNIIQTIEELKNPLKNI